MASKFNIFPPSTKAATKDTPVAWVCNFCTTWSSYKKEHNIKAPRGWRDTNDGYVCNSCRIKKGIK